MNTVSIDALKNALFDADVAVGRVTEYSGRGMYGDVCAAIVVNDSADLSAFFTVLAESVGKNTALNMAHRTRTDDMGLNIVAYWPGIELEGDLDKEEE